MVEEQVMPEMEEVGTEAVGIKGVEVEELVLVQREAVEIESWGWG